jgi:hypothetical protein
MLSPFDAEDAVQETRGWWSGNIEGKTDALGAEFTYRYQDVHYTKQRFSDFVPDQRGGVPQFH